MLFTPARRTYGFDLFDDFFNDPMFTSPFGKQVTGMMKTDIQDNGTNYLLDIELPGFKKEDIKAELKDGYLTITASREETRDEKDEKNQFVRKERFTGSCKRNFYVGDHVRQEDIKAGFENGILKIQVPKETQAVIEETPNYISIEG